VAEAHPADARGQALELDALRAPCRASGAGADRRGSALSPSGRLRWMSSGSPDSAASGTADAAKNSGRTYRRHEARERERRLHAFRPARSCGCCCVVEHPECRASGTRACLDVAWPSSGVRPLDRRGSLSRRASHCSSVQPSAGSRSTGSCADGLVGDGIGAHAAAASTLAAPRRVADQTHGDGPFRSPVARSIRASASRACRHDTSR